MELKPVSMKYRITVVVAEDMEFSISCTNKNNLLRWKNILIEKFGKSNVYLDKVECYSHIEITDF